MMTNEELKAEADKKIEKFKADFRARLRTEPDLIIDEDSVNDYGIHVVAKKNDQEDVVVGPVSVRRGYSHTGSIRVSLQAFSTAKSRTFQERKDGTINLDGIIVALREMLRDVKEYKKQRMVMNKALKEKVALQARLQNLVPKGLYKVGIDVAGTGMDLRVDLRFLGLDGKRAQAVIQAYLTIVGAES